MCKCRQNKVNNNDLGLLTFSASSTEMETDPMAQNLEMVEVTATPQAVGQRVFIPGGIAKKLRAQAIPVFGFDGKRHFAFKGETQISPKPVIDWMQGDHRYAGMIVSVSALETEAIEVVADGTDTVLVSEDAGVELPVEEYTEEEAIFEGWERDDIEDANINGDDGLKAYAEFWNIDLEGATLKDDILEAVLAWYDNATD